MKWITRTGIGLVAVVSAFVMTAGPSLAHECVNASKQNQAAGVQLVLNDADEVVWASRGLQNRIAQGLVNPDTGEGFHGLIGFDIDGDGVADVSTWIVGPNDEIPLQAQMNGAECSGVVNIGAYFGCIGL